MGIWIEYRCENLSEPSAEGNHLRRCASLDNSGPMRMTATDTRAAVLDALQELDAEAHRIGWKKSRTGWVCAFCAGQLGLSA